MALAGGIFLGGCTEPIVTTSDHPLSAGPVGAAAAPVPWCKLTIAEISDARLDPDTIGTVGLRVVHGPPDSRAWIGNALSGLRTYGIEVSPPPADGIAPAQGLTASVTLMTAWVSSFSTTKTGSVVLRVRYARDGTPLKETSYRGAISTVDWWGSTEEVQGMLDDSLTQILADMYRDLPPLCSTTGA
jgi:hypothetical protein